jgi:hypothetical protein
MLIPIGFFGGGGSAGAYEQIATAFGTGSSGVITFSSIPSSYRHLQIRVVNRSTRTGSTLTQQFLRFNGDTGSNYIAHNLTGNGSTVTSGTDSGTSNITLITTTANNATSNSYGVQVIDILDYLGSKNKTIRSLAGVQDSVEPRNRIALFSGLWVNTAAVTSITIHDALNNWTSQSRFSLYGIKG